ncbi:MAG: hypothetical protein EOO46_17175 [Flavobacterium sp.]|nr:MAG: hypothetical protein EOO46_17175 [Flavobacterium sp.]
MKKEMILPLFNFTYAHLKQLADQTLLLIERDMVQFTDRGFSAAKKTAFSVAIKNFADFPSDEQLEAIKMDATKTKDTSRSQFENQSRSVLLAAKNVFSAGSAKYREFGIADLTSLKDSDLVRNGKTTVAAATKYLTNLAGEGITAVKVTKLEEARTALDVAIDAQGTAITNRDNATEQRAILGNELYSLVVKYNDTGKDIWVSNSEARYNDYVIYNTVSGQPEDETPTPSAI